MVSLGTTESHQFIKACSSVLPNDTIQRVMYDKMVQVPMPEVSAEDMAYGQALAAAVPGCNADQPWRTTVVEYEPESQGSSSTDVGDVSWVCPTAQIFTATIIAQTPGHSWQMTTQGKTQRAKDMTVYASKVMAATVAELMTRPDVLAKAKEELAGRTGPEGYIPPIPKDVKPMAMNNFKK